MRGRLILATLALVGVLTCGWMVLSGSAPAPAPTGLEHQTSELVARISRDVVRSVVVDHAEK